jgi:hypothetical protein
VSTHGVAALRAALRGVHETVDRDVEVIVLAAKHDDGVLDYLTRHYLRGDVAAVALAASESEMAHCGIDLAFGLSSGAVVVRLPDDLLFAPGWLDAVVDVLQTDSEIGMLGLVLDDDPPRRGRPPKVRPPHKVERVDPRAFAVTREVLREHAAVLQGARCASGCRFQDRLQQLGLHMAYLPGQLAGGGVPLAGPSGAELEADLAFHPGEREAMSALRQSYALGDVVAAPCALCDDEEFEVLAVQIDFCESHGVPIGHTYALRCIGCHALRVEDDREFRCPA